MLSVACAILLWGVGVQILKMPKFRLGVAVYGGA